MHRERLTGFATSPTSKLGLGSERGSFRLLCLEIDLFSDLRFAKPRVVLRRDIAGLNDDVRTPMPVNFLVESRAPFGRSIRPVRLMVMIREVQNFDISKLLYRSGLREDLHKDLMGSD